MNKKKLIAAVICLVLVITAALPGTLAVSVDSAAGDGSIAVATPAPTETPAVTEEPKSSETPAPAETEKSAETEKPAETEKHVETEAPKTCTCDPAPAEGEAHKEGCPLYAAAAEKTEEETPVVHIEGCSDDCTAEECKCTCHLMKKIMECKTLEEIWNVLEAAPEETLKALTDEQTKKIDARIEELEPAPAPAIVIEESEAPVESEVYNPTVNYTYVAPFGEPVTGGN